MRNYRLSVQEINLLSQLNQENPEYSTTQH